MLDDPYRKAFLPNDARLSMTRDLLEMAHLQRKDSDDDLLAGWSSELEALLYSPEVEEAIKEVSSRLCMAATSDPPLSILQVYPSSNPLDQKDFNPIDYINELFPSEQVRRIIKEARHIISLI